ncbi:MAG: branched-chain amino acid ABC transporter permease [Syntrophorhabdaceae bacterium]|jgi:branched-subunit amino acid ABC-type transport system permease component|nr:branched-chain amino acid ABC transporter permease [Syntrophorhabdaceae bacterium]MDD5245553.1 branched-chain amino acid ABC transporter permease [Syntrophorhabdaceae bacterium]
MDINTFIAQFLSGLSVAMLLFLVSSGLTLIFGVVNVLNFAHGSFYLLGTYFAYQLMQLFNNFWVGLLVGAIGAGIVGMVIETLFLRRIYGRAQEGAFQLLMTYAFILILDDVVKFIWGPEYKTIPKPASLVGSLNIGSVMIPVYNVFIIIIGLLVVLFAWYFLTKTDTGKTVRASSLDRIMLGLLGTNVPMIMTLVFGVATAMGGLAGVLAAPLRTVTPGAGVEFIIDSMIVVVIGGFGNFWGALLGALIIGEVLAFGILWMPELATVLTFIVMIIVLIVKPEGLLAKKAVGRK